jgi:hypothetical protein
MRRWCRSDWCDDHDRLDDGDPRRSGPYRGGGGHHPREMPVVETLDLLDRIRRETTVDVAAVLANRVLPAMSSHDEHEVFTRLCTARGPCRRSWRWPGPRPPRCFDAAALADARRRSGPNTSTACAVRSTPAVPLLMVPELSHPGHGWALVDVDVGARSTTRWREWPARPPACADPHRPVSMRCSRRRRCSWCAAAAASGKTDGVGGARRVGCHSAGRAGARADRSTRLAAWPLRLGSTPSGVGGGGMAPRTRVDPRIVAEAAGARQGRCRVGG